MSMDPTVEIEPCGDLSSFCAKHLADAGRGVIDANISVRFNNTMIGSAELGRDHMEE